MRTIHKKLGIILFLLFAASAMAQKQVPPPGTVKLKPSKTGVKHAMYIDEKEITNFAWLEYSHWIAKEYGKESAEYKEILPDSIICMQAHTSPYGWQYVGYRNNPIVGITYEQAIKYCKWRTNRVNEMLNFQKNKKKYGYTVTYSLPTEADFKEAYEQLLIRYYFPYEFSTNELTAEGKVVIKGWGLSFKPYEEYKECEAYSSFIGFRCVAEIELIKK